MQCMLSNSDLPCINRTHMWLECQKNENVWLTRKSQAKTSFLWKVTNTFRFGFCHLLFLLLQHLKLHCWTSFSRVSQMAWLFDFPTSYLCGFLWLWGRETRHLLSRTVGKNEKLQRFGFTTRLIPLPWTVWWWRTWSPKMQKPRCFKSWKEESMNCYELLVFVKKWPCQNHMHFLTFSLRLLLVRSCSSCCYCGFTFLNSLVSMTHLTKRRRKHCAWLLESHLHVNKWITILEPLDWCFQQHWFIRTTWNIK